MTKMMTPPVDVYCLAKQETGKDCCAKSAKTFSFQSNTLDWSDPLLFESMFWNSILFIFTFCKNLLALFNQALSTGVINWSPVQSRLVKMQHDEWLGLEIEAIFRWSEQKWVSFIYALTNWDDFGECPWVSLKIKVTLVQSRKEWRWAITEVFQKQIITFPFPVFISFRLHRKQNW